MAGNSDGPGAVRGREPERLPVAALEQGVLVVAPAVPDGPDSVDDMARGEVVSGGDTGLADRAAADPTALVEEARPGCAVDRAVHPAAAEQRLVRGVDDRIHGEPSDVSLDDFDPARCAHVPAGGIWWAMLDLNQRPLPCEDSALPLS